MSATVCSQESYSGCNRVDNVGFVFVILIPLLPGIFIFVSFLVALWEQVEFEDRQRDAMTQHYRAQYESRSARVAPVDRERDVERERAAHLQADARRRASTGTIAGAGPSRAAQQAAAGVTAASQAQQLPLTTQLTLAKKTVTSASLQAASAAKPNATATIASVPPPRTNAAASTSATTPAARSGTDSQLIQANIAAVMQGAGPPTPSAATALEMTPLTRSTSADGL